MSAAPATSVWDAIRARAHESGNGSVDVWEALETRVDLAELRPKLRDDVEIKVFRVRWGNDYLMIANPRDLLHYRLPAADLDLLGMLDGTRTLKQIVVERFEESGELELSAAMDLVRTLYEGNFLEDTHVERRRDGAASSRPGHRPSPNGAEVRADLVGGMGERGPARPLALPARTEVPVPLVGRRGMRR